MIKVKRILSASLVAGFVLCFVPSASAFQGKITVELNMGQERPRLAVADFKAGNNDPRTGPLNSVFNQTLWYDLENAGIFEIVAKSFYPLAAPGAPAELKPAAWNSPPPNAGLLAFGSLAVDSGK